MLGLGVANAFGCPDLPVREDREHDEARVDDAKTMAIPLECSHDDESRALSGAVVGKMGKTRIETRQVRGKAAVGVFFLHPADFPVQFKAVPTLHYSAFPLSSLARS